MENFKLVCPCILGVEGLVADELRAMEAKNVEPQNGRVVFDGDINMLVRANLCSRYSERVLILLGTFQARSFEELFQGVKALPLETCIGQNDIFPVKGRSQMCIRDRYGGSKLLQRRLPKVHCCLIRPQQQYSV